MLFSEGERRELAEFFAKRFSDASVRSMLARQAGIDAGAAEMVATVAVVAGCRRVGGVALGRPCAKAEHVDNHAMLHDGATLSCVLGEHATLLIHVLSCVAMQVPLAAQR